MNSSSQTPGKGVFGSTSGITVTLFAPPRGYTRTTELAFLTPDSHTQGVLAQRWSSDLEGFDDVWVAVPKIVTRQTAPGASIVYD